MDQRVKELASQIAKSMINQEPLVYIASPFFDDQSREWVTAKEDEFTGMNIPFYSPRQDGINFNAVKGDLRAERISSIFKNNVRMIRKCKHIVINLTPCNGRLDIGTLWELGFYVGIHGTPDFDTDEYNTLAVSHELRDNILDIIKNLGNIKTKEDAESFLVKVPNIDRINKTINLLNLNFEPINVNTTLKDLVINSKNSLVLIDDYPYQLFILMGWMYANKLPYTTCSFKGYGSNVMIAASSEGHIMLPGVVDGRYNQNME